MTAPPPSGVPADGPVVVVSGGGWGVGDLRGAVAALGLNYYDLGRQTGKVRAALEAERLAAKKMTEARARRDALQQLQQKVQESGQLGEWLRRNGGTVIHLTRPGADGKVGIQHHASESGIIIETGDIGIHNGGTVEQLHAKLAELFPQRAAA